MTIVLYNSNSPSQKTVFFSISGTITHAFTISKLNCCEKKPGRDFSEAPTSACLQSYVNTSASQSVQASTNLQPNTRWGKKCGL